MLSNHPMYPTIYALISDAVEVKGSSLMWWPPPRNFHRLFRPSVYIIYIYIHVIYVLAEREYKGDGSDSTPRVEISLLSLEKLEGEKKASLLRKNK